MVVVCGVDTGGGVGGVGGVGGWGVFLLRDVEDGNLNHMMHWLKGPCCLISWQLCKAVQQSKYQTEECRITF